MRVKFSHFSTLTDKQADVALTGSGTSLPRGKGGCMVMRNLCKTAAFFVALVLMFFVAGVGVNTSQAQTIVDEWSTVQTPPPPELK